MTSPQIASARPEMTAAIMAGTGLDEDVLRDLVLCFYGKFCRDPVLGRSRRTHRRLEARIWSAWSPSGPRSR